jgi:hypothetical protein
MADPAYIVDGVLTDGEAWVAIASTTLGADAASITFTSTDDGQVGDFSQYMDLTTIAYWRSARAATMTVPEMEFNSDTTGTNYEYQQVYGNGSAVVAGTAADGPRTGPFLIAASTGTTDLFQIQISHLFDINSGKYKSSLHQTAADWNGSGYVDITTLTWKNQAAITSIKMLGEFGDLLAESRIDLFGILPRMVA